MKEILKAVLVRMHMLAFIKSILEGLRRLNRRLCRVDKQIVRTYFSNHKARKLHIGCGANLLEDWLNTHFYPTRNDVFHLDAVDTFPFENNAFDYVFSEHMIEHIPFSDGYSMLKECHRVLREGGKIRISTPDLKFLFDLYQDEKTTLQTEYIKWNTQNFIQTAPYSDAAFVINNYVRDWGHCFIYDEKTLKESLQLAGFSHVTRCELGQSEESAFQNLENERRMPKGFLRLESFCLEATK